MEEEVVKGQRYDDDSLQTKALDDAIACLEKLQQASKRTVKEELLRESQHNSILRSFFKYAYDVETTYGIVFKMPDLPKTKALFGPSYSEKEEWPAFVSLLQNLATRKLSGQKAFDAVEKFVRAVPYTHALWYVRTLNRDLKVGAKVATYGKIWPELRSQFGVSKAEKIDLESTVLNYPVAVEPKLDGLRITVIFRDHKGVGKTRSGREYNHILHHIISELAPHVECGAVDGEVMADWAPSGPLACYGGKFYKSPWGKTSAMLKTGMSNGIFHPEALTDEMWEELRRDLKLHAFDFVSLDVYDFNIAIDRTPFYKRRNSLEKLVSKLGPEASTVLVKQEIAADRNDLDSAHKRYMDELYEGSMIKDLYAPYRPKRTTDMLKRKEDEFIDGVIIGVNEGKNANKAGSYRIRLLSGEVVDCAVRGETAKEEHWLCRDDLIGVRVELSRQKDARAVTSGARFPVFSRMRDDLPKEDV